jgi:hypothetical protein
MTHGTVFTTLYFISNLQISLEKLAWGKHSSLLAHFYVMSMTPEALLITPHFLCNF